MPSLKEAALLVRDAEQSFLNTLVDRSASHATLRTQLQAYRAACDALIFTDITHETTEEVETQLWNAHAKLNVRYRRERDKLQESDTNLAVEKRKLLKDYLGFVKSSQLYYRQYILQLDHRYGGIEPIRKEAQNWKHESISPGPTIIIPDEVRNLVMKSCYRTLIHLGDLSRWRASEIDEKPNWSPAVGYYSLATELNPASGIAHHQQAIISRAEKDHFRTLYHLYRAASTTKAHPSAEGSLELEFKKVRSTWARGELMNGRGQHDDNPALYSLVSWFVRLHSKCYTGQDFPEHYELENEVTSQLAIQLKERPLDGTLQKMVLINMAAEYFASIMIKDHGDNFMKAYFLFLRLNVKTFFTLLQILQPELERLTESRHREDVRDRTGFRQQKLSDKITSVARRVLPVIRLYSVWFLKNFKILLANLATTMTEVDVQELFKAYINTLTLLASAFPVKDLPASTEDYLLEEDADTIGFSPLIVGKTSRNWYKDGKLKHKWSDRGVERHHPNDEMLIRIRDLLVDGLELVGDDEAPVDLDGLRFIYREAGLPSELLASPQSQPHASPEISVDMADIQQATARRVLTDDQASHDVAPSETTSVALAKDTAMNKMVDNLVGEDIGLDPLQEEDENLPPTPPEQTFDDTAIVADNIYGITPIAGRDFGHGMDGYSRRNTVQDFMTTSAKKTPASPAIRHASILPSLPDQDGIWNPTYITSNPGSPYPPNSNGLSARASATSLTAMSRGHSRNGSLNANAPAYGPAYDAWHSSVTIPHSSSARKATGLGSPYTGYANGSLGPQHDPTMASSFLFGTGSTRSLASPAPGFERERNRNSLRQTPPNGQGG